MIHRILTITDYALEQGAKEIRKISNGMYTSIRVIYPNDASIDIHVTDDAKDLSLNNLIAVEEEATVYCCSPERISDEVLYEHL